MVSVIIPAFNEENYLGVCLKSLANQTQIPDEVVICDNGSTDHTQEVIKAFQNQLKIKVVFEKQKGIRFAVDKAWRAAAGDIILRTDADCVLPSNWVKSYQNIYLNQPNLAACGGGFCASDGNLFIKLITPFACDFNHCLLHLSLGYRFLFGGNFSIRRSVMVAIDGYSTTQSIQDDILICQKLHNHHYQYRYLPWLKVRTSTRSFKSPKDVLYRLLSNFNPKFYLEKSN